MTDDDALPDHFSEIRLMETIDLDDASWVNCRFVDCRLRYGGGDITITGCSFDGGTWAFHGAALNTIEYLRHLPTEVRQEAMRL